MKRFIVPALLALATPAFALSAIVFDGPQHGAGGGYTGPGDIATFDFWVSTARAYSSATRGNNAVNLCQPAGSNCVDVASDATTGLVPNAPTVNGSACDNSGHQCFIKIMYDQTGGGFNQDQSTGGLQPAWHVSATGSHPCGQYTRASLNDLGSNAGPSGITQPFTVTAVVRRSSGQSANQNDIAASTTGPVELYHGSSADNVSMYAGSSGAHVLTVALTDNTFGSVAAIFNGGSSYLNVNSTTTSSPDVSTNNPNSHYRIGSLEPGFNFYDGDICEVGFSDSTSSTATADSLMSNAKTAYGF